jgi:hypothetical protein
MTELCGVTLSDGSRCDIERGHIGYHRAGLSERQYGWVVEDLAYLEGYLTLGCGPGKHTYPGNPNDIHALLVCSACGATKKMGITEARMPEAIKHLRQTVAQAAEGDTVRIWGSWAGHVPRLVAEMSREDWLAGKEIPRLSPLAWGEAWLGD